MQITDYAKTLSAIRLASLTSENLSDFKVAFDGAIAAIRPIEFAAAIKPGVPTKKNCTKGVYCIGKTGKGSCVKAGSKCKSKAKDQSQQYTSAIGPAMSEPTKTAIAAKSKNKTEKATEASKSAVAKASTYDKKELFDSPDTKITEPYEGTGINVGGRISAITVPAKQYGGEILNQKTADKLGFAWVSTSRIAMLPDHLRDWDSYSPQEREDSLREVIAHLEPIRKSGVSSSPLKNKYVRAAELAIAELYDRLPSKEKQNFDKNEAANTVKSIAKKVIGAKNA